MRLLELIKKTTLGARLNILVFVIFSFLLLGMVLATNIGMNSFMIQAGRRNVEQEAQIIRIRFEEIEREMLNNAVALSNTPGLLDALTRGNIKPVQSDLLIAAARLDFDDVDTVNAQGRRLFDVSEENSAGEDRLLELALLGFNASGIVMGDEPQQIYISVATPVHDNSGKVIGAVIGSRLMDDKMLSKINVISGHSLDLALIIDGEIVATDFEDATGLTYFSSYMLEPKSIEQALNGQVVVAGELFTTPGGSPHALGLTPVTIGADTRAVVGIAVNLGDLLVVKDQLISDQRGVFAFFAIIGNVILALFATYQISRPIHRLQEAADKMASGDYSQRVSNPSKDEVGLLTNSFNSMAGQLQNLVTELEDRVAQRTLELEHRSAELEQTSKESEKRARDLRTIAEIGQYLSTEKDLELLLPLVTRAVSERFGFYHVGIFLLNESGNYAILRAANSPGGQKMLDRQHKLEVGQVGIVGMVTATGVPRIALDTGSDAVFFNNPDLPDTHSEMALPLTARGKIIGALDVQSTVPNAFTDTDISTLSLLADQIAISIDNVRLLQEAQEALAESQSIFREYLADSWQKKSASGIVGYHQTLTGGQVITANKARDELPDANENGALTVPIKLRNQTIGTLDIRPITGGRHWRTDEVNIVRAVAERLGLALDNARLFEETSARASRERLVTDITTKIRSTNDPQEMVRTAVEELKRALGVTRVEIIPQKGVSPSEDD